MKNKSQGFGLILLIITIAVIALLATWQLTGGPGKSDKQSAEGLMDQQEKAKADLDAVNEQLKLQYPPDSPTP